MKAPIKTRTDIIFSKPEICETFDFSIKLSEEKKDEYKGFFLDF